MNRPDIKSVKLHDQERLIVMAEGAFERGRLIDQDMDATKWVAGRVSLFNLRAEPVLVRAIEFRNEPGPGGQFFVVRTEAPLRSVAPGDGLELVSQAWLENLFLQNEAEYDQLANDRIRMNVIVEPASEALYTELPLRRFLFDRHRTPEHSATAAQARALMFTSAELKQFDPSLTGL